MSAVICFFISVYDFALALVDKYCNDDSLRLRIDILYCL